MRTIVGVLIVAALACGSGCAKTDWIDRTLVTVDVTGVWTGTVSGGLGGGEIRLELQQNGPNVTGHIQAEGRQASFGTASGPIEGRVSGDTFTFKDTRGGLTAELIVKGDEMRGTASASTQYKVELRRVDPVAQQGSPPR